MSMPVMTVHNLMVTGLAGLSMVLTGCSADHPAHPTGVAAVQPEPTELVLPFDAYRLSVEDDVKIMQAETVLMRECMREKDFEWTRPSAPPPIREQSTNARRYGVIDEGAARERGYHLPDD